MVNFAEISPVFVFSKSFKKEHGLDLFKYIGLNKSTTGSKRISTSYKTQFERYEC